LGEGLAAVAPRLDAERAVKAAEAILAALHRFTSAEAEKELAGTLRAASESRATADLIPVLAHPLCAGPAQRAVLDVLGARCKRHFRNTWHFIDWAEANGVDLTEMTKGDR